MTSIAELGIRVDSAQAAQAATDLDKLTQAGAKAEKSASGLATQTDKAEDALKDMRQQAQAAEKATAGLAAQTQKAGVSAAQTAAALRGVPAQFTDIVTSLQGGQAPLTVLLQQGGQLKDMFGGIGPAARALGGYVGGLVNPFTLAAGAVTTLGVAYYKGSQEADEYQKALILTGNSAGVTADNLASMARQVSATVGTTGAAAAVLAKLAGSGNIAAYSFEGITKAALTMQQATGAAIEDTVAQFAALGKDPVEASIKLDQQYHYLTASVLEQVMALEKQGQQAAAVKVATDAFADAIESRGENITARLGYIEGAWNKVAKAAKWAWDSALDVGRDATYEEKMAQLETQAENARRLGSGSRGGGGRSLKDIEAEQKSLMLAEQERRNRAQANKDAQDRQSAAVLGVQLINRESKAAEDSVTKLQNKLKDLDKARQENIQNKSYTPELQKQYETAVAGIQKQMADAKKKAAGPAGALDMSSYNTQDNALKAVLSSYSNTEKELEAAQRAGLVSQADYAARRTGLVEQEAKDVAAAYQAEITALEAIRSKSTTTANQRIQLDQKISDTQTKAAQAQKGYESEMRNIATAETGRLKQQEQAVLSYTAALQDSLRINQQQLDASLAGLGMGDQAAERAQERLRIEQDYQNKAAALARDLRTKRIDEGEYDKETKELQDALNKRLSMQEEYYQKVDQAQQDWTLGAKSSVASYFESANNMAAQSRNLFDDAFSGMEDAVVSFAKTGKLSFSDFAESVISDLLRIAVRQSAVGIFNTVATAIGGGVSAGSTAAGYSSSTISSWLANGHSDGGYTGDGDKYEPKGVVHGGEFVLRKEVVSQPGMRNYLEGLNAKGYADGGYVAGAASRMAGSSSSSAPQVHISIASDGSSQVSSSTSGLESFGAEIGDFVSRKYKELEAKSLSPQGNIRKAINGRA
jgi:lambda family phage tail tape measure protein